MTSQTLYLARHGETDWNAQGRWQGRTDVPLNANGRAQGRVLGDALRGAGVVGVVSSDLSRARETARIVAEELGVEVFAVDADLRERGFGVFEGLTREGCERLHPEGWRLWCEERRVPEGGELSEAVAVRFLAAMARAAEVAARHGGPLLVVAHGGAMRVAVLAATGELLPPIANGDVFRVDWQDGIAAVARLVLAAPA